MSANSIAITGFSAIVTSLTHSYKETIAHIGHGHAGDHQTAYAAALVEQLKLLHRFGLTRTRELRILVENLEEAQRVNPAVALRIALGQLAYDAATEVGHANTENRLTATFRDRAQDEAKLVADLSTMELVPLILAAPDLLDRLTHWIAKPPVVDA